MGGQPRVPDSWKTTEGSLKTKYDPPSEGNPTTIVFVISKKNDPSTKRARAIRILNMNIGHLKESCGVESDRDFFVELERLVRHYAFYMGSDMVIRRVHWETFPDLNDPLIVDAYYGAETSDEHVSLMTLAMSIAAALKNDMKNFDDARQSEANEEKKESEAAQTIMSKILHEQLTDEEEMDDKEHEDDSFESNIRPNGFQSTPNAQLFTGPSWKAEHFRCPYEEVLEFPIQETKIPGFQTITTFRPIGTIKIQTDLKVISDEALEGLLSKQSFKKKEKKEEKENSTMTPVEKDILKRGLGWLLEATTLEEENEILITARTVAISLIKSWETFENDFVKQKNLADMLFQMRSQEVDETWYTDLILFWFQTQSKRDISTIKHFLNEKS
eukprot:GHVL01039579.1.p1 GENE.GHVL01039579.1~~GHVL01039579.1.p1  ORF type:complete len:387 (+),score=73.09 GHVL01039579.1:303-1463(+)